MAVMQVFRVQRGARGFEGRRDDQRVIDMITVFCRDAQCRLVGFDAERERRWA